MIKTKFGLAWDAFRNVYGDGSVGHVGGFLGGNVKKNVDAGVFTNACALRMSHVLHTIGIRIPFEAGKVVSGKNHKWYLFRIRDLLPFMSTHLGPPDLVFEPPAETSVQGVPSLLVFEVAVWADASGHATLYDGRHCSDHCYFPVAFKMNAWKFQ